MSINNSNSIALRKLSALIVDDDAFLLGIAKVGVAKLGFGVVNTAISASVALDIIETSDNPISLLLLDLNMPETDGIELLRYIKDSCFDGDIILLSGEDNKTLKLTQQLANQRGLSVIGVLRKPLNMELLEGIISHQFPSKAMSAALAESRSSISAEILQHGLDNDEILPWFQPKIDIKTKQPVGVEALARWPESSRLGRAVYPDEFIPIAEESQQIDRLTAVILDKSLTSYKLWMEYGIKLKVAVNISMDSLEDIEFTEFIYSKLVDAGLDVSALQLEITESRLLEDVVNCLEILLRLRMKRISISIDDFGTGHSNLSKLLNLPFDELKLDRSFVTQAVSSRPAKMILESSIRLAKELKMRVVAEGIETLEQWQLLEDLGCDEIQGYFIARPMPAEELISWFTTWEEHKKELFAPSKKAS